MARNRTASHAEAPRSAAVDTATLSTQHAQRLHWAARDSGFVLIGFTVLTSVSSPTVSKCLALGFLSWICIPIDMDVLLPVAIFTGYQWTVRQIKKGVSAGELV
ncbi:hypothetical protein B0H10DRAFT_2235821 [Mycena sp. CBHHK59/15]|nr:hypothetical protein B0H10DRAFT_2235821 [Mycena sp. CBHHK59/15]